MKTIIIIGTEINYFTPIEKNELLNQIIEIEKIIKGLQNYLKNSEHKGYKYNKVEEGVVDYYLNEEKPTLNIQL